MSKDIVSAKDRLDFVSFMNETVNSHPELRTRLESLFHKITIIIDGKSNSVKSGQILHHSPLKMIEFLRLFSIDDHFKWYTHKWDQDGVTLNHLIDTQAERKRILSSYAYQSTEPINEKTYNQVWNFINFNNIGENIYPWYDNEATVVRIGWYSIIGLSKQNQNSTIENLKFSDGSLFIDYIRKFKSSIEFRTDLRMDDRFNKVIRNSIKRYINGAVQVKYTPNFRKIGYDVNIYCDVPGIVFSLKIISDWIVKHKVNGSDVIIDLTSNQDSYELSILHRESYFTNVKRLKSPSGDFANLRNRLFSVCDFTMRGDLKEAGEKNGSITIFGLNADSVKSDNMLNDCRIVYSEVIIGGVMYVFKFYKG